MSTGTNSNFPKARTADLITERVGDELVVYDGKSSEAHCLSALAAAVFVAADGKTSTADLAAIASRQLNDTVDVPAVEQALAELEDRGLVEVGGISRRGFMQRSAAVGGAAFAATMVTSVVTPSYGSAASTGTFGAWSSLAVLFDYNGSAYGAHWSSGGTPSGNPPTSWDATEANANCALDLSTIPSGQTESSGSIPNVTAATSTSSITITVPVGVAILSVAAFFGQGGTGCHGCQTSPGGQSDSAGTVTVSGPTPIGGGLETYMLTFAC
jgi:PqqD family protein of HPr-rel-A system